MRFGPALFRSASAAMLCVAAFASPAHAAQTTFWVQSADRQTEAEFTVQSALTPSQFGPGVFDVAFSVRDAMIMGQAANVVRRQQGIATTNTDGGQLISLYWSMISPFFPTQGFDGGFSVTFESGPGQLFQGDMILTDTLTRYFDSSYVAYAPQQSIVLALPEPSTWGVMIIGLAMAGGALRRGRPQRATVSMT